MAEGYDNSFAPFEVETDGYSVVEENSEIEQTMEDGSETETATATWAGGDWDGQTGAQKERDREALDWQTEAEWQELYRNVREGVPPSVDRFNRAMRLCMNAVEAGLGFKGVHRGLDLLALMEACGTAPNLRTYNTFLLICAAAGAQGSTTALDYGVRVVQLMQEENFVPGRKSCSRLLSALVSIDSPLVEPEDSMERGLNFLSLMRDVGLEPDQRSFDVIISGCFRHGAGAMHAALRAVTIMSEYGVEPDTLNYAELLHCCARSGFKHGSNAILQARKLFDQMEASGVRPDVAVYNALLHTHVRAMSAEGEDAFQLLEDAFSVKASMEAQGVAPDGKTYVSLLHAIGKCVEKSLATSLVRAVPRFRKWLKAKRNGSVATAKLGDIADVDDTDNAIMRLYTLARSLIDEMEDRGLVPTDFAYNALLDICAKSAVRNDGRDWMSEAFGIVDKMNQAGIQPTKVTYNTLLDTCAQMCGRGMSRNSGLITACKLIDDMVRLGMEPDAVSYTCFINAARKEGTREAVELAYSMFRKLPNMKFVRNKHTYTSMIRALSSVGRWQEAVGLLEWAREAGVKPDRIMYSVCMEAVGHDRDAVRQLHARMLADGIDDDMTTRKQLERVDK
jgi:pentatricopeptide repeat protein